jgi:hypothetical protein
VPTIADRIVSYAREQLGDPYVWGAEGPNGFDCSGLVYAAYKAAGLNVSRTTAANLGKQGTAVPLSQARPGDVAYFDNPGTTDHVAIVSGNGRMIEAPTFGTPVREVPLRTPTSIRRMPGVEGAASAASSSPAGASASGSAETDGGGGLLGGVFDVFDGWQNSLQNIALKITAGAAVVALVVVGAKTALQDKGTA